MWYYALDGERQGPVEKGKIQDLIDGGDLGMDDLVWTSRMDDWTPISEVDGFQPSPPPLPQEESPPTSTESSSSSTSEPTSSDPSSQTTEQPTPGRRTEEKSTTGSTENTDPYAGFGRRLIAYVIDILILVVFGFAVGALIVVSGDTRPSGNELEAIDAALRSIGFLLTWMYFALNESSRRQATWGKQLMGLKVTDLSGDKIGFWKATGRHFGKILSGLILFIGFIMAAFTEKKQALHDMMAGCLVIEGEGSKEEVKGHRREEQKKEGRTETKQTETKEERSATTRDEEGLSDIEALVALSIISALILLSVYATVLYS